MVLETTGDYHWPRDIAHKPSLRPSVVLDSRELLSAHSQNIADQASIILNIVLLLIILPKALAPHLSRTRRLSPSPAYQANPSLHFFSYSLSLPLQVLSDGYLPRSVQVERVYAC